MKITGIKKAIGEYKWANSHGCYSPWYANIMLDTTDGRVWTDTFYDLGHGSFKKYHSKAIVCVSGKILENNDVVSMKTLKEYSEKIISENF